MNKKERLMAAIGNIDEKYVKESEGKAMKSPVIKIAVSLCVIVALGLYLFLPFASATSNLTAYKDSEYFPLIESIEDYRLSFKQPTYNNNFEALMSGLASFGDLKAEGTGGNMASGDVPNSDSSMELGPMGPSGESGDQGENGSYVESTDNQVTGVIESDLMKMTDKYIFRLAYRTQKDHRTNLLRVYSIEKEDSALVAEFDIPSFDDEFKKSWHDAEMFLSEDGNTVTVVRSYTDNETDLSKVGVTSVDVSNINDIKLRGAVSIDGSLNTTRMIDGRLLIVSEYFFNRNQVDYDDPATFVPSISTENGSTPIRFDDIIFPDTVGNTRYSVVGLFDAESLELLGASALLNFTDEVYVSENNVYITREYTEEFESDNQNYQSCLSRMTDIAVLNYSGETLEKKGVITMKGWAEDQYSLDERDGYLRVVASTRDVYYRDSSTSRAGFDENVSLYIYDLKDNSLAYSLLDFAIEGEEATAVRFRGDTVYVCTAVKINFTDPVYFIDLSDYENILSADTGVIEGYSDHLIDLGEGFLLGIGREDWQYSKVEIYEQQGSDVVSVAEFKFEGDYSLDYKSYLVNREHNLFGFGVNGYYYYDEQTGDYEYGQRYVLLQFNGYELTAHVFEINGLYSDSVRAAYIDGYLYITTPEEAINVYSVE